MRILLGRLGEKVRNLECIIPLRRLDLGLDILHLRVKEVKGETTKGELNRLKVILSVKGYKVTPNPENPEEKPEVVPLPIDLEVTVKLTRIGELWIFSISEPIYFVVLPELIEFLKMEIKRWEEGSL